ncbi:D-alanyl-D-alanine carboxypeptidase [Streptomyces sp. CoH27]|uniref:D-alanyl-D-alanine carboxypeptidase n=1 Tax=Streptomyces sp. CoH27 TaxID=2875763 RepID=UPI001CD6F8B6|nr:D-alanyl-D-alanine carboxypeptidase [Streptomyces sp. CoH27]
MAGESPDRSKQRESSAEPTPGSGGSVPEARDPRLAVSREKDSADAGGGVDTATKVLTVPATAKAEAESEAESEDAALQEAVSAWVRDADAPEADAGAGAGTVAAAKTAADSAEENTGDATADSDGATEADTATEATATTAEDTEETADAVTNAGADAAEEEKADAKADAREKAEADADAEPDTEEDEAEAKSEGTEGDDGAAEASEESDKPEAATPEGDKPQAADGEDAPQGPPAGDDETPTGGAGGNADAEGEAEAKTPDAPQATRAGGNPDADADADAPQAIDQPTAVFKAPRKQPQVDQPTTMLKLGSDPERTSKFVALKPDLPDLKGPKEPKEPKGPQADVTTPVPQVGPERTTQQPLPPKPPLDLLAELTNTPPPPETPVRTLVRRVKIWTPLVLLLAIVFVVVQALRPLPSPALALTAKGSYTFQGGQVNLPWPSEGQGWMDGDGIGTMGHFGNQTPVAIGSVAKTMTAYIILRDHPLKPGEEGPKIKVDAQAQKEGGYDKSGGESTLNTVKAGDYLTEKQALSAVMIPSANNIARLLARWDAGSEAAFVKKMNATATELGMTNTTYTDPSGLTASTVSTAEDQVKLGRAVVRVPALVAITSAASWTDPSGHNWSNVNELPYLIGAIGIKTGSTTAAGGNLLFASRKTVGGQTVTIVGAILGQHKPSIIETVNAVSKTALLAAQDALTSAKILKKGDVVGYVDDQLGGHTPVVVTKDVSAVGWSGLEVKLSFTSATVPNTAKAGTTVAKLTVGDGSGGAVEIPVALQQDLTEPGFGAKLTRLG